LRSGCKLRFALRRISLSLAKTGSFRCLCCEPGNCGLGLLELSPQVLLRHGNGIRHSRGGSRYSGTHSARCSGAVYLVLDLPEVLAACWSLFWARNRAGRFVQAALRSYGIGGSRGDERLAAGTVDPSRSCCCRCAVGWQEKDPDLLLLNS
jgi:hypothetical protein